MRSVRSSVAGAAGAVLSAAARRRCERCGARRRPEAAEACGDSAVDPQQVLTKPRASIVLQLPKTARP